MKKQKGITLVALIITIIVMVILAGVIIVSAVADGGIIDRAESAMKEKERAEAEELVLASYVYKTTASTTRVGTLDLNATADAIYENLTTNGFTLMDGNTQAGAGSDILEGDKINLNIVGKHGNYSGTVTEKGLEDGLISNENGGNIDGDEIEPPVDETKDSVYRGTYDLVLTSEGTVKVIYGGQVINEYAKYEIYEGSITELVKVYTKYQAYPNVDEVKAVNKFLIAYKNESGTTIEAQLVGAFSDDEKEFYAIAANGSAINISTGDPMVLNESLTLEDVLK